MKAPDKIYLWETPIIKGGYDPAWHRNSFNDSDVEYIRKEALLEWLHFKKCNSVDKYVRQTYEEVINKLNQM